MHPRCAIYRIGILARSCLSPVYQKQNESTGRAPLRPAHELFFYFDHGVFLEPANGVTKFPRIQTSPEEQTPEARM